MNNATPDQISFDKNYLLERFEITKQDLELIRKHGKSILNKYPKYVDIFYVWLAKQVEYSQFFADHDLLKDVQKRQVGYWKDFFEAKIDANYIAKRQQLGTIHAEIKLPLDSYLTAVNKSLDILTVDLLSRNVSDKETLAIRRSVTKLLNMDNVVVVGTFMYMTNLKIAEQTDAILEMSTPVAAIWEGILLLPIVGIIDSARANDIMNSILSKILETQSKVIILDISGVAIVDTAVANHLIKITKASKLMGCECTITGMSAAIAQTIVELGIDIQTISTTANLKDSLQMAFKTVDLTISARAT